jgi:serine/threonine-protein kinase
MVERAITEQGSESPLNAITAQSAQDRGVTEQRLRQIISGDLQTIAQKCLEARPSERYGSVDALAQDVKRYLDGEPVMARRQTTIYRLGKFIRRHRVGVGVGVATGALLIGSLGYAAWRQEQALREAQRAERMQTFMHQLFRLANSNYTGKPSATVPEFLQLGVKILPDYIHNPSDLLQAKVALAESMFDNGALADAEQVFQQTGATAASMKDIDAEAESKAFAGHIKFLQGDVPGGEKLTAEALHLSRQEGVSPMVRVWAADFYGGDRENLGLITDENLDQLRFAANEARSNHLPPHETATAIYSLATNLEYLGKLDEASPLYDEALSLFAQDADDVCDPAAVYGDIGYLHYLKNDPAGSLPFFQRSYDGYKRCSGAASRDALSILSYMTDSLILVGRSQQAISLLEGSWPDWEKISGGYVSLSEYPLALSQAYIAAGRYSEAEKLNVTIIETRRAKIPKSSSSLCEFFLAQSLAGEHRYQDALPHADLALRAFRRSDPRITLSPFGYTVRAQVEATDADIRTHLGLPKLP